jgi:hypothetical protein
MHKKVAIKNNSVLFLLVHFFEREIFDQKKLNVFFPIAKHSAKNVILSMQ